MSLPNLVLTVQDISLFCKLNTVNNRFWFTLIFEPGCIGPNCELTVYYSNSTWESKLYFYDFYKKNEELKYCIQ